MKVNFDVGFVVGEDMTVVGQRIDNSTGDRCVLVSLMRSKVAT